jgi:predicted RND superfamily exporter protein
VILVLVITGGLMSSLGRLSIVIDPDETLPQTHPYLVATNLADRLFGNKFAVVIGLTPQQGDALQPAVLTALRNITDALAQDPGVVRSNLASLSARKIKDIRGSAEGLEATPLLENASTSDAGRAALQAALSRNPVYAGLLLSRDERTAAIVADFKKDAGGFKAIAARLEGIVAPHRSPELRIDVAGQPIFLGLTEVFSDRMALLFPLALIVIGLIHFEAFRSWQGLVLPLVTGLVATAWGLGIMGWTGTPLDAFNATTPILILAVGAGHAVQILKRYYEEYGPALQRASGDPACANRDAIIRTLAVTGPVMIAAGLTAAASFASLMVFQIGTIRTFGLFTSVGILSALAIELTLIPALRAILPPPGPRQVEREAQAGAWDKMAGGLARLSVTRPRAVVVGSLAFLAIAVAGATLVRMDNSLRSYFLSSLEVRKQDRRLNAALAGNNVLSVIIRGREEDAIKSPAILRGMEATQRFLERESSVGKTVSLVDFIRQIDRAINNDDNPARPLPDQQDLIAQYLLLYSISGSPGDFDSYVDSGYRNAVVTAYLKEESSAYLADLSRRLRGFVDRTFPPGVEVLIGGNVMSPLALNEVLVGNKLLNIAQIALAVFVVSSVLFRSFAAGALVLVPLVLAVAGNFGLMGWAGIPLQVVTATVSAMAVGIGADYAIYLLYRLREEALLASPAVAIDRTFRSAGKAVMFVATAIAGGYAVMMLSWGFLIHFWLGLLISVAMLVSAAAALTVLPALAMILRPAFLFDRAPGQARSSAGPVAVIAGLLLGGQASHAQGLAADEVMRRNFTASKVTDSAADATFTLISADGQQRIRRTQSFTKLRDDGVSNMRLTRFLSPPDVRGTATLTIENPAGDDDIWIYLPALKRVRRLLASNKKDSFVGTDFSYGDVIGFKVEEWRHTLVRQEAVDGAPCYVVDSLAASAAAAENSGYGRRLQWIRTDNFVAVKGQYFDPAGRLWKTFAASDLKVADPSRNRWQPMKLDMRDVQSNHETIIQLENFRPNQGLTADMFNARMLDREQ